MSASFAAGTPGEVPVRVTLADGIAVKLPGQKTLPIIRACVDEIVLVEEEEIAQFIAYRSWNGRNCWWRGPVPFPWRRVPHGKVRNLKGKTLCLLSGGNIDVKTIALVVERGLLAAGRYLKLRIELDDLPGALATLAADIAATRANISLINHERRSEAIALGKTSVALELETRGHEHRAEVIAYLRKRGYSLVTE